MQRIRNYTVGWPRRRAMCLGNDNVQMSLITPTRPRVIDCDRSIVYLNVNVFVPLGVEMQADYKQIKIDIHVLRQCLSMIEWNFYSNSTAWCVILGAYSQRTCVVVSGGLGFGQQCVFGSLLIIKTEKMWITAVSRLEMNAAESKKYNRFWSNEKNNEELTFSLEESTKYINRIIAVVEVIGIIHYKWIWMNNTSEKPCSDVMIVLC